MILLKTIITILQLPVLLFRVLRYRPLYDFQPNIALNVQIETPLFLNKCWKIQTYKMYLLEKFLSRPIFSTTLLIFVIIVALIIFRFKRRLRSLSTASSIFTFGMVWIQFRNDINNSPMQQAKVQRMQTWTCFIRSVSIFNVWK